MGDDHSSAKAGQVAGGDWHPAACLSSHVDTAGTIRHYAVLLDLLGQAMPNPLTRRAYGYHSPDSLIAMADLTRGSDPCISLT